jgi:hypothetical protein
MFPSGYYTVYCAQRLLSSRMYLSETAYYHFLKKPGFVLIPTD